MRTRNRIRSVVAMTAALLMVFSGTALAAVTAVGSPVSTNGGSASTLTLNAPALDAGDVLLAQIVAAKDFTSSDRICPPTGWTSIERVSYDNKVIQEIFTYSASSAVAATGHTWTVRNSTCAGSPSSNKGMSGGLMRYSGVDIAATVDGSRIASSSSDPATAPAVTTVRDSAMVVRFFAAFKALTFTTTTNRLYNVSSTNISSERTAAAFQTAQGTAGSTGTFGTGMSTSAEWVATTVALQGVEVVDPVIYGLTVSTDGDGGGTVTSNPAGIDCGTDCSEDYEEGTSVTLTASAEAGSSFTGWSGGDGTENANGTYTVTMSESRNVTATFTANPVIYGLTVSTDGDGGGTVTSNPAGIDCGTDCSEDYEEGTSVTLTASAEAGSSFTGWSGGDGTENANGTYTVTMSESRNVTATFTANPVIYGLTVSTDGDGGGTVTSNPAGIDCGTDCSEDYEEGTSVTLTASAEAGSSFTGWSGGDGTENANGTYTVTMSESRNVTATFTANPVTYRLSVDTTGSGTVTSNPAGIDCGSDCGQDYDDGTTVTLTATAATGWEFAGWSGHGTDDIDGQRVVSMTEARNVTATFTEQGGGEDPGDPERCDLTGTGTFLAPLKDGIRNIVKLGNVIPVKLSVICDGEAVTDAELSIKVTNGSDNEDTAAGEEQVGESVSKADTNGVMRLSDGKYMYNLATKNLKGGFDYTIVVKDTTGGVSWSDAPIVGTAVIQPKK